VFGIEIGGRRTAPKLMLQRMIPINKLERKIEYRLRAHKRLVRAFVALVTNAVMCLMVIASARVFEILINYYGRDLKFFTTVPFRRILDGLDILIITVFAISALAAFVKISRVDEPD
jgi:hypothetical protein